MVAGLITEGPETGIIKDRDFGRETTICSGGSDHAGEGQP